MAATAGCRPPAVGQAQPEHRPSSSRSPPRPRDGGAEAVTLVNTVLGHGASTRRRGRPVLGAGGGGLSGPAIHPVAVRAVLRRARRAAPTCRSSASAGWPTRVDAVELLLAGASRGAGRHRDLRRPAGAGPGAGRAATTWCAGARRRRAGRPDRSRPSRSGRHDRASDRVPRRRTLALALDVDDLVDGARGLAARAAARGSAWPRSASSCSAPPAPTPSPRCRDLGFDVFVDLKLHDIPTTVGTAPRVLGALGADVPHPRTPRAATAMLRAGVEGLARRARPRAGTARADRARRHRAHQRRRRAARTSSPSGWRVAVDGGLRRPRLRRRPTSREARALRAAAAVIVVPGIRPAGVAGRTTRPASADAGARPSTAGADLLVIGRGGHPAPTTRRPRPRSPTRSRRRSPGRSGRPTLPGGCRGAAGSAALGSTAWLLPPPSPRTAPGRARRRPPRPGRPAPS